MSVNGENADTTLIDTISSTPPFRPHQLAAAYLHIAHVHFESVSQTANAVRQQSIALGIASRSLDLNILTLSEAFDPFAQGAQQALNTHKRLLAALDADLATVASVRIHPAFLSTAARRAIKAGDPPRTLGNYVDNNKMRQVADGCARTSGVLSHLFYRIKELNPYLLIRGLELAI